MSVDSSNVSELCAYVHSFIEAMSISIIALILLYHLLGVALFVGVIIIAALIPAYVFFNQIGDKISKRRISIY